MAKKVSQSVELSAGDLLPTLVSRLTDLAGNPLDLTTATLTFRLVDYRTGFVAVNDEAATSLQQAGNPTTKGLAQYIWQAGDTDTPGLYQGWWTATFSGSSMRLPADGSFFVLINPAP